MKSGYKCSINNFQLAIFKLEDLPGREECFAGGEEGNLPGRKEDISPGRRGGGKMKSGYKCSINYFQLAIFKLADKPAREEWFAGGEEGNLPGRKEDISPGRRGGGKMKSECKCSINNFQLAIFKLED